jgi:hypothetical protein
VYKGEIVKDVVKGRVVKDKPVGGRMITGG